MPTASRLIAIAMLATFVGCAATPGRAPDKPAPVAASQTGRSAPAIAAGRSCPAPLETPFTVVPQSGVSSTAELRISSDGRIAAAKSSFEIQLWNVTSGSKFAVVSSDGAISHWALRPDGRMVAIVSDGQLSLVDPTSRAPAIKVAMPANVERLDFRSDGKALFVTRAQETSIVDLAGAATATIAAVSSPGAISADGRFLFSRDGAMWDVATGKIRWKAGAPSPSVTFSADGQSVALATGQSITVLDSLTGNKRWEAATKGGLGGEISLSPDGQSAAAYDSGEATERGYEGRGMALWSRGKRMRLPQSADAAPASRASFSPDGKLVGFTVAGNGVELRLADARTGARVKQPKIMGGEIREETPRWSADGRTILQPGTNGVVVIDVPRGERRILGKASFEAAAANTVYRDAVFGPDGGAILIVAEQASRSIAAIVDLKTGAPRDTLEGRQFRSAEWNAATGLIAIDRNDGVALWDGHSRQAARVVSTGDGDNTERELAFAPQGNVLATLASPNKEVKLWDPKTGARLRTLAVAAADDDGSSVIEGMAFNADGSRIALKARVSNGVEQSTHIAIYETGTGNLVRTLHAPRGYPYAGAYGKPGRLDFTPQGKGIVSVDGTGRVDLWNTATDDPPIPLIEKARPGPSTLAVGSDSRELLLMGTPTLDVWDLRTHTLARELQGDGSPIVGARIAPGSSAIAVTRVDRVELHRLRDQAYLTVRVSPASTPAGVQIVADNGAFIAASAAAATASLRVRDGAALDVRSLRANEIAALQRPSLALDFVSGCPR